MDNEHNRFEVQRLNFAVKRTRDGQLLEQDGVECSAW